MPPANSGAMCLQSLELFENFMRIAQLVRRCDQLEGLKASVFSARNDTQ